MKTSILIVAVLGLANGQRRRPDRITADLRPPPANQNPLRPPSANQNPLRPPSANQNPPRQGGNPPRQGTNPPNIIFGGFSPLEEEGGASSANRKPLRFPLSDEETRRNNFIEGGRAPRPTPRPAGRFPPRGGNRGQDQPPRGGAGRPQQPPRGRPGGPVRTVDGEGFSQSNGAQRGQSNRPNNNNFSGATRGSQPNRFNVYDDYEAYDYGDRQLFQYDDNDQLFDYEDDPLPAGPTRAPPLPSGPTRRPGQPTRRPSPVPGVGVPREVFQSLPLLSTPPPPRTSTPRANVNFRLKPPTNQGREPVFRVPDRDQNGLLVSGGLDILDQTSLFTKMDPHQEQFIKAPTLNAGALPLAIESSLPLNRFPPFVDP